MIRAAVENDAKKVAAIYNHYVATTCISFDEKPKPTEDFAAMIRTGHPFLVYEENDGITGFAYTSPWKAKTAYRFTHESTIYLKEGATGKEIGQTLYEELINTARQAGLKSLVACIVMPHDQSVRFHEKMGFKQVAHFKKVGYKFDRWLDVGYWQKELESGE